MGAVSIPTYRPPGSFGPSRSRAKRRRSNADGGDTWRGAALLPLMSRSQSHCLASHASRSAKAGVVGSLRNIWRGLNCIVFRMRETFVDGLGVARQRLGEGRLRAVHSLSD